MAGHPPELAALYEQHASGLFRYTAEPGGFVIYSLGENRRDDGGMVEGVARQPGETPATPLDAGVRIVRGN